MNEIPVFLASDDKFAPFIATTLVSILQHTKSFINCYVLDSGISQKNKDKILKIYKNFTNIDIEFININVNKYFFNLPDLPHISKAMYFRLLIPLLKPEFDKVIYSDIDVVFEKDIESLYNVDLEEHIIGAVPEYRHKELGLDYEERMQRLGLNPEHPIFMSGLLIIDVKKWNDNNVTHNLLQLAQELNEQGKLVLPDQDILNKYFENNYKCLDKKFCVIPKALKLNFGEKEIEAIKKEAVIYHYAGGGKFKPWNNKKIEGAESFWEYVKYTDFKSEIEQIYKRFNTDVSFLQQIFSVKNQNNHKILRVLGLKFKFKRYHVDKKLVSQIKRKFLNFKTVLMIEVNDFHGEIIPGYAKYLIDMGFRVDLLTTKYHLDSKVLSRFQHKDLTAYYTNVDTIERILADSHILGNYAFVFVNSYHVYRHDRNVEFGAPIDVFLNKICAKKRINVLHNVENMQHSASDGLNPITLSKTVLNCPIVNPHYFGNIKITQKNEGITKFLISGDGQKNFNLIISAVELLLTRGINNFEVNITGRWEHEELKDKYSNYIHYWGFVDFDKLYSLTEMSDFIIPCLDPRDKRHIKYLKFGTSGAFQLSYGFLKPCIINSAFTDNPGFNNTNAILYSENKDLTAAMIKAIQLSGDDYSIMQNNLKILADNIEKESIKNLEAIIRKI